MPLIISFNENGGCDRCDLKKIIFFKLSQQTTTNLLYIFLNCILDDGLELHERLLEHSLNSTDYSLQSSIVRNGRDRISNSHRKWNGNGLEVHSLPRNNLHRRKRDKMKLKSPPSAVGHLIKHPNHSDVAHKADELFA